MENEIYAACTERISTLRDEISVLGEESQKVETETEKQRISDKIVRREREISELEEIVDKITLQQKQKKRVIDFVDTIDEAHEYFDFKNYLREECGTEKYNYWQDGIEDILVLVPKKINMFSKVSEKDIYSAVDEHIVDVRTIQKFEGVHRLCESEYRKVKGSTSELTREDYKEMDRLFPNLCLHKRYEHEDLNPDTNPVYRFVCQSREKDYVMDENPEIELLKIEESAEDFDESCIFSDEEGECTESTVSKTSEDITSNFKEALDKYSKLRNHGKKTVKNVKDDSGADQLGKLRLHGAARLDKYSKLNLGNHGEDTNKSQSSDSSEGWATVNDSLDGWM